MRNSVEDGNAQNLTNNLNALIAKKITWLLLLRAKISYFYVYIHKKEDILTYIRYLLGHLDGRPLQECLSLCLYVCLYLTMVWD